MPQSDKKTNLRIVIVDDHPLVRSGIKADLPADITVVGEAENVSDAVAIITATKPEVVLLDVHLPDGNGGAVISQVGSASPATRFLAVSVSDDAADVMAVVRLGARGYVTKSITAADLSAAIRRVAGDEAVFSPRLAGFVLDAFKHNAPEVNGELDRLTPRERDVMRLIARGDTYKEAADELFLSVKTIETHMSAVLRKLQLSNRRELARWARANDVLDA